MRVNHIANKHITASGFQNRVIFFSEILNNVPPTIMLHFFNIQKKIFFFVKS